ncbi:MAG TPA: hypothetical protein VH987_02200 [Candidatus Limnocylindria bacterium]
MIWLLISGAVLCGVGLLGVVVGTWQSSWLYAQLPPVLIDADAVGGAAAASGYVLLGLGVAHLASGELLRRRIGAALLPVAVLCATMALLAIGWGVASLVSAASAGGPPAILVPGGIGLGLVALAYGWSARGVIRLREGRSPAS